MTNETRLLDPLKIKQPLTHPSGHLSRNHVIAGFPIDSLHVRSRNSLHNAEKSQQVDSAVGFAALVLIRALQFANLPSIHSLYNANSPSWRTGYPALGFSLAPRYLLWPQPRPQHNFHKISSHSSTLLVYNTQVSASASNNECLLPMRRHKIQDATA